jgi:hypothetical protein
LILAKTARGAASIMAERVTTKRLGCKRIVKISKAAMKQITMSKTVMMNVPIMRRRGVSAATAN